MQQAYSPSGITRSARTWALAPMNDRKFSRLGKYQGEEDRTSPSLTATPSREPMIVTWTTVSQRLFTPSISIILDTLEVMH